MSSNSVLTAICTIINIVWCEVMFEIMVCDRSKDNVCHCMMILTAKLYI